MGLPSRRRRGSLAVTVALAAAVAGAVLALGFVLQDVGLPPPSRGSIVALRVAAWFRGRRLFVSSFRVDGGRWTGGVCASSWFPVRSGRNARGSLLRFRDGFAQLVIPPHRLERAGGTPGDRRLSPLVAVELAGCSGFFAQKLQSAAEAFQVRKPGRRGRLRVLELRVKGTRLSLYFDAHSYRPLEIVVSGRRVVGASRISFGELTTSLLRRLETALRSRPRRRTLQVREELAVRRLLRAHQPIYCAGAHGRLVALTFDDGPGPYTALALRILRRAHASATFFLVGRNLARARRIVRREAALGALGNHTWTHPYLPGLRRPEIAQQLAQTQQAIRRDSGRPVELFRPPYGATDATIDADARRDRMLLILWSIDTRDSEGSPWHQIARTVEQEARPGAIVLMHENHGQTIRALKFEILPWLRRHRLAPVSVPYLLLRDPPSLAQLRAGERACTPRGPRFRPGSG